MAWFNTKRNIDGYTVGKAGYSNRPLNIVWTPAGINQLFVIEFKEIVAITFLYLRQGTGTLQVSGQEFGPRLLTNEINAVNVFSVSNVIGVNNVARVVNAVQLDLTNNTFFFEPEPYRTRLLYLSASTAVQYILNISYIS